MNSLSKGFNSNLPLPLESQTFTVSDITQNIKQLLESKFRYIQVIGEISNYKINSSGHAYFTLKDRESQISCAFFRAQRSRSSYLMKDGDEVLIVGGLNVYPPQGKYQIIVEKAEPKGLGDLQLRFFQLKDKLQKEGLFDEKYKKGIPAFPKTLGVVTSPSGAAIHDIIKVTQKRFPGFPIIISPASVQGEKASKEIVQALKRLDASGVCDVIIVGRGGGALEDLWCFNEETVARAIFEAKTPIISAVGHETDFTISDFVADMRAATPSAAAEIAIPNRAELLRQIDYIREMISQKFSLSFQKNVIEWQKLQKRLLNPARNFARFELDNSEWTHRLHTITHKLIDQRKRALQQFSHRIELGHPHHRLKDFRNNIQRLSEKIESYWAIHFNDTKKIHQTLIKQIEHLSPLHILERGYSITRNPLTKQSIQNQNDVSIHDTVEVLLHSGRLQASILKKEPQ